MISKIFFVVSSYALLAWFIYSYRKQEKHKSSNAAMIGAFSIICLLETIKLIAFFVRL